MWACFGVFALIGLAGVTQPTVGDRLVGLIWLGGAALGAILSARLRVSTGPDGVTIVGFVRSRHLSWSDVDRFELVDGQGVLVAGDGRRIMLVAIGGFRFHAGEQQRLVAALDEDRARAGQQGRPL